MGKLYRKYKDGGKVNPPKKKSKKPLFVDSLNDPRYIAYKDSLNLHELSKLQQELEGNLGKLEGKWGSKDWKQDKKDSYVDIDKYKEHMDKEVINNPLYPARSFLLGVDERVYANTSEEILKEFDSKDFRKRASIDYRTSPDFYHNTIKPIYTYDDKEGMENGYFKKPTREVKVKPKTESVHLSKPESKQFNINKIKSREINLPTSKSNKKLSEKVDVKETTPIQGKYSGRTVRFHSPESETGITEGEGKGQMVNKPGLDKWIEQGGDIKVGNKMKYAKGGKLYKKLAKGGKTDKKVVYVDSKTDPRYKAYADSTTMHNVGELLEDKLMAKHSESVVKGDTAVFRDYIDSDEYNKIIAPGEVAGTRLDEYNKANTRPSMTRRFDVEGGEPHDSFKYRAPSTEVKVRPPISKVGTRDINFPTAESPRTLAGKQDVPKVPSYLKGKHSGQTLKIQSPESKWGYLNGEQVPNSGNTFSNIVEGGADVNITGSKMKYAKGGKLYKKLQAGGMTGSNPYAIAGALASEQILASEGEEPDKATRAMGTAAKRAGQGAQYGPYGALIGGVGGFVEGASTAEADIQELAFNKEVDANKQDWLRKQQGELALQNYATEGIEGTQMYSSEKGGKIPGGSLHSVNAKGGSLKKLANGIVEVDGNKPSKTDGVTIDSLNAMVDHDEVMTEEPDGSVFVISDKLGYADEAKTIAKKIGELEKRQKSNPSSESALSLERENNKLDNIKVHQEMSKNKEKAAKGGYLYTKMQDGGKTKSLGTRRKQQQAEEQEYVLNEEDLKSLSHQKRGRSSVLYDKSYVTNYNHGVGRVSKGKLTLTQAQQLEDYMNNTDPVTATYESMPNMGIMTGNSAAILRDDSPLRKENGGKLYNKMNTGGLAPGQELYANQPGSLMGSEGMDGVGMGDYAPDAVKEGRSLNMPNMPDMSGGDANSPAPAIGAGMEMMSNIGSARAYTSKASQARRQKYGIDEKDFGSLIPGKGTTLARAEGGKLNYENGGPIFGDDGTDARGFTQKDYDKVLLDPSDKDFGARAWNKANPGYDKWISENPEYQQYKAKGTANRDTGIDTSATAYFRNKYSPEVIPKADTRPINIPEYKSKRTLTGATDVKEVPTYYEPEPYKKPNDTQLWRFINEPSNFAALREMERTEIPQRELNPFMKSEEVDYRAQRANLRDTSAGARAGTENVSNTALRAAMAGSMRGQEARGVNESLGLEENTNVGIRNRDIAANTQIEAGNRGIDFSNKMNTLQGRQDYLTERSKVMAGLTDDVGMTIADADSRGIQRDQQLAALAADDPRKYAQLMKTNPELMKRRGFNEQTYVGANRGGKLYQRLAS